MPDIDRQWYWDRRSNKAYYPVEVGEDTVRLTSVWHREEVEGALESGALAPATEIGVLGLGDEEDVSFVPFDGLDSLRLPDDVGGDADPGDDETDDGKSGGTPDHE